MHIHMTVREALDNSGNRVRSEFRHHSGAGNEVKGRIRYAAEEEQVPEPCVVGARHGNGQGRLEEVSHGGRFGKAAEDVVGKDIKAVHDVEHREDDDGLLADSDTEPLLKEPHAHHDFQKEDADACVHERVAEPVDAHMVTPVHQGVPGHTLGREHHLDDVAHARDAEPDKGAEPGEEPPVLGIQE